LLAEKLDCVLSLLECVAATACSADQVLASSSLLRGEAIREVTIVIVGVIKSCIKAIFQLAYRIFECS
jgi:hypothetical protein